MSIEFEYKWVLSSDNKLEIELDRKMQFCSGTVYNITQGYLGSEGRIRRKTCWVKNGIHLNSPTHENFFTYKHSLTMKPGCLEIETKISDEDFELAWFDEAHSKLEKTRYCIPENHLLWEIDCFYDNSGTYLILAECELNSIDVKPLLPDFLTKYHLFSVTHGDKRFNNRNLGDRQKVKAILEEIKYIKS